jgi:hypothetical protein
MLRKDIKLAADRVGFEGLPDNRTRQVADDKDGKATIGYHRIDWPKQPAWLRQSLMLRR